MMISPSQIKAARALLGWKQEDLSEASGISLSCVRNLEMGYTPRDSTINAIRSALENGGLEFIENDGIRRSSDGVKIYQGHDSCDKFFADVLETIKQEGGDVFVSIKTQNILASRSGSTRQTNLERLEELSKAVSVYCLLSDTIPSSLFMSPLEMRSAPASSLGAASCLVYGNKSAQIVSEGRLNFLIVVFTISTVAHDHRLQFLSQWNSSMNPQFGSGRQEHATKAAV